MRKGSEKDACRRREMVTNEKTAINEGGKSRDDDDGGGGQGEGKMYVVNCLRVRGFVTDIHPEPGNYCIETVNGLLYDISEVL
jgi:hypothetical protein